MTGVLTILTAANIWMVYCIWFRPQPTTLLEVAMLTGDKSDVGHESRATEA